MRRLLLLLLFVIPFVGGAIAGVKVQTLKSPGGIEVWLVEERGLPIVNIEAVFRGGRSLEPAGKAGLARLTSYMMDEGAGDLGAQAFMAALADSAVNLSFGAEAENMTLSLSFLKEKSAEALHLGALALTKPRFDLDSVKRMKDAILVEQTQIEDDPASKADLVWWQMAFAGTPYGVNGAGDAASIKGMGRNDILAFHAKAFSRARLIAVIVGDIGPAEATSAVDALFGGLPTGEPYSPGPPVAIAKPGVQIVERDVPQTVVVFGLPALKRNDPDFRALHTLNYMLGGGSFASRLMQEVRVKRGLVYSVNSSVTTLDRAGILFGTFATKNETAGEALNLVRAEIARLRDDGPSEQEVNDAKAYLTGSWPLSFDSNASTATQLLAIRRNDFPPDYADKRNAEIEALTTEKLRQIAKKYLDPDRMFVVVLGKPQGLPSQ